VLCCPFVAVLVHQSCCCAGNGDASSAAPAADPNPAGDVADPPAVGGFTFPSSGVTSGFPAFAGATNLTPTFGGASGATTASSASTTAEGGGKGRATAGAKSAARSKAGKSRVKTKAATAVGPTATAATAGADRPTPSFSFSGVDPFAGKWLQVALPPVAIDCAYSACILRQCSLIVCVLPVKLVQGSLRICIIKHHLQSDMHQLCCDICCGSVHV